MIDYQQKLCLKGKTALVTGAGQGIGSAIAEGLAATGAELICTDISQEYAEVTARQLNRLGYRARAYPLDVTDSLAINALAASLPPLNILVCNAGIVTNTPAETMTDEEWEKVISVNLTGVFLTCRGFGKRMLEAGSGSIINIGSMSGHIVNLPQPQCHYNASKAGVHHLTKSLAVEWATRGVRVNAVAPTYIETPLLNKLRNQPGLLSRWLDLTPAGRLGKPHEVASVVQFLASDASGLLTGSIITADAGYTSV